MKKIHEQDQILKDRDYNTKVIVYMSTRTEGDDYDPYENNKRFSNLNPITVFALVRDITPETAYYKNYGVHQGGVKELICDARFRTAFENANKVVVDGVEYQLFKDATGANAQITSRAGKKIRVVVARNG
jgi:hypothetical protein